MKNKRITNLDTFLRLPDWKKVELKIKDWKYRNYPLMTQEQENTRINKIFQIILLFNKDLNLQNQEQVNLRGYWPVFLESIITPRLLDLLPLELFINDFSNCVHCRSFIGFNKNHIKMKQPKVIPLKGFCDNDMKQKHINPRNSCNLWIPANLIMQIIHKRIEDFLINCEEYSFEEYKEDLINICFWDYFFDEYSSDISFDGDF